MDPVVKSILALFPRGALWTVENENSPWLRLAQGLSGEIRRVYARAEALLAALAPWEGSELLGPWLRTTGRATAAEALALLAATGGQSIPYLLEVLERAGFGRCRFIPTEPWDCTSPCAGPLYGPQWRFSGWVEIERGDAAAAQRLLKEFQPAEVKIWCMRTAKVVTLSTTLFGTDSSALGIPSSSTSVLNTYQYQEKKRSPQVFP